LATPFLSLTKKKSIHSSFEVREENRPLDLMVHAILSAGARNVVRVSSTESIGEAKHIPKTTRKKSIGQEK
jgi:hypothetical protein